MGQLFEILLLFFTARAITSGCGPSGQCFSECAFGLAWCYTTKGESGDGNYVSCKHDRECSPSWSCAKGICNQQSNTTEHFNQAVKKGAPGDTLTLLQWNVYGMMKTPLQKERATEIGHRLQAADIVLLQEAWCSDIPVVERWKKFSHFLYETARAHGFNEVWNINGWNFNNQPALKELDSGLGILSKYPIEHQDFDRHVFSTTVKLSFTELDALADKGIAYAKIKVNANYNVHVFTTHTQAHYSENPTNDVLRVQNQQMEEIIGFMRLMSERHDFDLKKDHVVLAGDFNSNFGNIWDIYRETEEESLAPIWDSRKMMGQTRNDCPDKEFTSLMVWERTDDQLTGGFSLLQPNSKHDVEVSALFQTCFTNKWWARDAEIQRDAAGCPREFVQSCPCCSCTADYCLEYAVWDLQFYSESLNEIIETKRVGKEFSQWEHFNSENDVAYHSLSDHWPTVSSWKIPE